MTFYEIEMFALCLILYVTPFGLVTFGLVRLVREIRNEKLAKAAIWQKGKHKKTRH